MDGSDGMASSDGVSHEVDDARDLFMNHLRQFMDARGFVHCHFCCFVVVYDDVDNDLCVCVQNTFGGKDANVEWKDN